MKNKSMSITRQKKRRKQLKTGIDESKKNAGGFYEGMPGVTTDEYGNREMIKFIVKPDGVATSFIYAHPQFVSLAIENAIDSNVMVRHAVTSAVVNHIFQRKTIGNWILRMAYKRWYKRKQKVVVKTKALKQSLDGKTMKLAK